jgi:hypothetical protein
VAKDRVVWPWFLPAELLLAIEDIGSVKKTALPARLHGLTICVLKGSQQVKEEVLEVLQ